MNEVINIKPRLLIYDLDGCVIDSSVRLSRTVDVGALARGDYQTYSNSFNDYHKTIDGDEPIALGINLVASLKAALCVDRTVALTARGEEGRDLTLSQLRSYMPWDVESSDLLMRPSWSLDSDGNNWQVGMPKFSSALYKRGVTEKLLESYDIVCAIDDHDLVVEMYRSLGITTIHLQYDGIDCLSPAGDNTKNSSIENSSIENSSIENSSKVI